MKDGIKICLVLGIVAGAVMAFASLILSIVLSIVFEFAIILLGILASVLHIIVCGIAIKNIDSYGSGLAVVVLMFGSFIAGILMLSTVYSQEQAYKIAAVLKTKDQVQNKESQVAIRKQFVPSANNLKKANVKDEELNDLRNEYANSNMTKDEFEAKKAEINNKTVASKETKEQGEKPTKINITRIKW